MNPIPCYKILSSSTGTVEIDSVYLVRDCEVSGFTLAIPASFAHSILRAASLFQKHYIFQLEVRSQRFTKRLKGCPLLSFGESSFLSLKKPAKTDLNPCLAWTGFGSKIVPPEGNGCGKLMFVTLVAEIRDSCISLRETVHPHICKPKGSIM